MKIWYLKFPIYKHYEQSTEDIKKQMHDDGYTGTLSKITIGKHLTALGFEIKVSRVNNEVMRLVEIDDDKFKMLKRRYVPNVAE